MSRKFQFLSNGRWVSSTSIARYGDMLETFCRGGRGKRRMEVKKGILWMRRKLRGY